MAQAKLTCLHVNLVPPANLSCLAKCKARGFFLAIFWLDDYNICNLRLLSGSNKEQKERVKIIVII